MKRLATGLARGCYIWNRAGRKNGRELQTMVMAAQTLVATDVCPQAFDGGFVPLDLGLIFTNLHFGRTAAAVQYQPVAILLELPLIALDFALVCLQLNSAASLGWNQSRRTETNAQHR